MILRLIAVLIVWHHPSVVAFVCRWFGDRDYCWIEEELSQVCVTIRSIVESFAKWCYISFRVLYMEEERIAAAAALNHRIRGAPDVRASLRARRKIESRLGRHRP